MVAKIEVPEHILDAVVEETENYFAKSQDRLLGVYPEEAKEKIRRLSTHAKVRDPERRELHRHIISEVMKHAIASKKHSSSDKPTMVMFGGPPGVGKSTLRQAFDKGEVDVDGNPQLKKAYDIYKNATASHVSVDFEFLKSQLPEYRAANTAFKEKYGDMYAVIRCEASGLNVAITKWAKELGLTNIAEQLMDTDVRTSGNMKEIAENYNLVVIGLTADPELCRERVSARKQPMQDSEVSRAIQGFSNDNAFGRLSEIANHSFLFKTDERYKPVFCAEKGKETYRDPEAFEAFKQLKDFEPKEKSAQLQATGR